MATTNIDECEDFYSVLDCDRTASYEELKHKYQQLIRKYHPDKRNSSNYGNEKFLLIDKAWKTLRDEHFRKQYNASQIQADLEDNTVIHAQLLKTELIFDSEGVFKFSCRCGCNIVISKDYLSEEEFIVECDECSNSVIVI